MADRDFLSMEDVSEQEIDQLLDGADRAKANPESLNDALAGKQVALIFEKPSTRTRVSFEAAVDSMGGDAVVLRGEELQLGRGETLEDTARSLSLFVHAIVLRTFEQQRLQRLAAAARVPVINALSDHEHPCQVLGDLQTIREKKDKLQGVVLAYLGDGNNVAHSLMIGGVKMGMDIRVASPANHRPDAGVVTLCEAIAPDTGGRLTVTDVVAEAAHGADILYTDVWASMGQESEAESRRAALEHYQLNSDVLELANDDALVMHCLPAHRGEEITADVLDGPRSMVWDQAENRLHSQKALLAWILS